MGMGDELGQVRPGFLADLLLVDGDPTAGRDRAAGPQRLRAIMKDGRFHKDPALAAGPVQGGR
jgi:imidazolonepropionase-like amidohydrolase